MFKAFKGLHKSRLLEDTPTSLVRSAPQGYIELEGTGHRLEGDPIIAPLTTTRCTWWSYRIEIRETYSTGKTRYTRWRAVDKGHSDNLFELRDSTGRCLVDPDGAEVLASETDSWRGSTAWPILGKRGMLGRYRYTENRMHDGDPLIAIGYLTTHRDADTHNFEEDVRELLAEWKNDPERLLRQHDHDGDGTISLKEWEKIRLIAEAQIRAEHAEQKRSPGIPVLADPPDGRNYLLAARTHDKLASHYRRGGAVGIVLFFVLLTVGVTLISLRLGLTG